MKHLFIANIRKAKIEWSVREKDRLQRVLKCLKDGLYDISICKHKNKRTLDQNAYYFGVVIPILSKYFGYEPEEMHEELKLKFNPIKSKLNPDKIIGGSTRKMSTTEFFGNDLSYVERIRRWAAVEFKINIPDPEKISQ